jgi:hypothetical protein
LTDKPYTIETCGTCMGDLIPERARFWVDPTAEIRPGNLCSVVLSKVQGHWRSFLQEWWEACGGAPAECPEGFVKIFVRRERTSIGELVWLAHLSPPAVGVFRLEEIESMHAVLGPADLEFKENLTPLDRLAWAMVAMLRNAEPSDPINPNWRPETQDEAAVERFVSWAETATGAAAQW